MASRTKRRIRLFLAQDGRCAWCNKLLLLLDPSTFKGWLASNDPRITHAATFDHFVCKSHGGKDDIDNLVLACMECNNKRGNMTVTEFLLTLMTEHINV
jgi:5-methylcytosine-specific restriction endonuclease McrA